MLRLNTPTNIRRIAITVDRINEPKISAASLAERYDISEGQVYKDLAWAEKRGYFDKAAKAHVLELHEQRSVRAREYMRQLRTIVKAKKAAQARLKDFLENVEPPHEPADRIRYEQVLMKLEYAAGAGYTLEQQRLEGMLLALEESMAKLMGVVDELDKEAEKLKVPTKISVYLMDPLDAGRIGTS